MNNASIARDVASIELGKGRDSGLLIAGFVVAELFSEDGTLKARAKSRNLITSVGDAMYAGRGAGIASPAASPTGMRLGTGSTAVAKTGAGAAVVTKLTDGNQAFDATFPSLASNVVTYKTTYAAGKATSASAITEVVLVNDTIATDTATAAANTIARVLLTGIGSKGSGDTLAITWTHTLTGA